jgi:membrane protein DedA with SNARE-associated domain
MGFYPDVKIWRLVVFVCGAAVLFLATIIPILVLSHDALGLLDEGVSERAAYFLTFALIFGDAIIPLLPGETTLNTASVLASQGSLELVPVMIAGALGAVMGDSALYWLARLAGERFEPQVEKVRSDQRVERALKILGDRSTVLLVFGRYVPGLRFLINATMGATRFPYPHFFVWSAVGGTTWAIYTTLLAYHVGTSLEGYPLASILISGAITTGLILIVFWTERRRSHPAAPAVKE